MNPRRHVQDSIVCKCEELFTSPSHLMCIIYVMYYSWMPVQKCGEVTDQPAYTSYRPETRDQRLLQLVLRQQATLGHGSFTSPPSSSSSSSFNSILESLRSLYFFFLHARVLFSCYRVLPWINNLRQVSCLSIFFFFFDREIS